MASSSSHGASPTVPLSSSTSTARWHGSSPPKRSPTSPTTTRSWPARKTEQPLRRTAKSARGQLAAGALFRFAREPPLVDLLPRLPEQRLARVSIHEDEPIRGAGGVGRSICGGRATDERWLVQDRDDPNQPGGLILVVGHQKQLCIAQLYKRVEALS